jgi:hypothetical protein
MTQYTGAQVAIRWSEEEGMTFSLGIAVQIPWMAAMETTHIT